MDEVEDDIDDDHHHLFPVSISADEHSVARKPRLPVLNEEEDEEEEANVADFGAFLDNLCAVPIRPRALPPPPRPPLRPRPPPSTHGSAAATTRRLGGERGRQGEAKVLKEDQQRPSSGRLSSGRPRPRRRRHSKDDPLDASPLDASSSSSSSYKIGRGGTKQDVYGGSPATTTDDASKKSGDTAIKKSPPPPPIAPPPPPTPRLIPIKKMLVATTRQPTSMPPPPRPPLLPLTPAPLPAPAPKSPPPPMGAGGGGGDGPSTTQMVTPFPRSPIVDALSEETWRRALNVELRKPYFAKLLAFIARERRHIEVFPPDSEVLSALNVTSLNQVRVVILGQDPYFKRGQGHGLCFSVRKGVEIPPSLDEIYKELETDIPGWIRPRHGCLLEWATRRGILLLNTTLTVRDNLPSSHSKSGWQLFTNQIIRLLDAHSEPVVFLLWGYHARSKAILIKNRTRHRVFEAAHPSPQKGSSQGWSGCHHFSQTNDFLLSIGRAPIDWSLSS